MPQPMMSTSYISKTSISVFGSWIKTKKRRTPHRKWFALRFSISHTNPAFELVGGEGKAGDVVQVKLNLKEDTTFEDLTLGVYYDPSKLAVDSEENDIILSQDLTTNMIWGTTLEKEKRVEYQKSF